MGKTGHGHQDRRAYHVTLKICAAINKEKSSRKCV